MDNIRITKIFHFEMAHALMNYDGACKNIHGHSYRFEVTIIGKPLHDSTSPKNGMLMDFGDLKRLVHRLIVSKYDHALVLNSQTDTVIIDVMKQQFSNIIVVDYQPTSEMMIQEFAQMIKKELPENMSLYSLRLYDAETSFAEWYAEDNL